MKLLYPEVTDTIPHDMPVLRGKVVNVNIFVDTDHAENQVTRRSHKS